MRTIKICDKNEKYFGISFHFVLNEFLELV
jgi:hypothetical protein